MERKDDMQDDLRGLLKSWDLQNASASLEDRVMRAAGFGTEPAWWQRLLTGYIRIPVPVACCAAIMLAVGAWRLVELSPSTAPCQAAATAPPVCHTNQAC